MSTKTVASTLEALLETQINVAQAPESESEFFLKHMNEMAKVSRFLEMSIFHGPTRVWAMAITCSPSRKW